LDVKGSMVAPRVEQQDCELVLELIPAYSLGATDPDETEFVNARLADCPEAVAELARYRALAEAMLFSAPAVAAPPQLAQRLQAATTARKPASQPAPPRPAPPGLWQRLRDALASPQLRPALAVAVAAVVLLAGLSLLWSTQLGQLRQQQQLLAARLNEQEALLAMVGEGQFVRVELPAGPAGEATAASAAVICDPNRTIGFIQAESLPPLADGMAYQVWLIKGEERVSGGLFQVDDTGHGRLAFEAPEPLGAYDAIGITPEPASGSPGPTSPPVIRGELYSHEEGA
jgi:anti-sigma factor RsiW